MAKPDKIRIPYEDFDDGRFHCVGRYDGDKQFMAFVSGAFPDDNQYPSPGSNWRDIKRWLAVIHRFDSAGNHLSSEARVGGYDAEGRDVAGEKAWDRLGEIFEELSLKHPEPCDIFVKLFSVEIDGITHGLIYENYSQGDDEGEYVTLEPNDIMFCPPYDDGEYST
jgi:formate hydrogenlyase regulatory protein HycA